MKFITNREQLLTPLQQIVNVIEKRQTMPILSNVLINIGQQGLVLTGTDLEIQIIAEIAIDSPDSGQITIPGRKFLDICRSLPSNAEIKFELIDDKVKITSGRSRFSLSTLDAGDYPKFSESTMDGEFTLEAGQFKIALEKTIFSMANQDVRYFLNGLLMTLSNQEFKLIASDGHRLSIYEDKLNHPSGYQSKILMPRKGVIELSRLLDDPDEELRVQFSSNNIRIAYKNLLFSAKLIDAKYPEFSKVYTQQFFEPIQVQKNSLKDALTRVSILSNEKFKGVSFAIDTEALTISTHNPEHEEAEETLNIEYSGDPISISFNSQYFTEAISNLDSDIAILTIALNGSCCFIEEPGEQPYRFIVMPMRI